MKKDIFMKPVPGAVLDLSATVSGPITVRGEFFQHDTTPDLVYRQIRLSVDMRGRNDKLTTIMIRPDTPGGRLNFDVNGLLSKDLGFELHSITALDDMGRFVLKATTSEGPFDLHIDTNPEGMNFRPMPGLLVTLVELPFQDDDWARS